jgi:outer membrane protein assembly factor BamB
MTIAFVALGFCCTFAWAGDNVPVESCWPQFRGSGGLGLAPEGMTLPVHFGPNKNVLWKTSLPRGISSPCIWGSRIFLTGYEAKEMKLETFCLNARDGRIVWRKTAPAEKIEKWFHANSPATPTPATDGERVYVYFGSYGLLCYDMDGKEIWKKALPPVGNEFGSGTSPVVAGDVLLLGCQGKEPCLLGLNSHTGEVLWKKEKPIAGVGYSVPLIRQGEKGVEVVLPGSRGLQAFDVKTGTEHWQVTGLKGAAIPSPAAGDGLLFFVAHMTGGDPDDRIKLPSFDDLLKKFNANKEGMLDKNKIDLKMVIYDRGAKDPDDNITLGDFFDWADQNHDGKVDRKEWANLGVLISKFESALVAVRPEGQGDITKNGVLWRENRALPEVPSPLYYRERLYVIKDGGVVSCFEGATGKLLYRKRLGASGFYYASLVAGDGKIYAASTNGVVSVFQAGDKLRVLARNSLADAISATPAFADGRIYVRTDNALYAFRE